MSHVSVYVVRRVGLDIFKSDKGVKISKRVSFEIGHSMFELYYVLCFTYFMCISSFFFLALSSFVYEIW